MSASILHAAIDAVCPIAGCSVGLVSDRTTWKYTVRNGATPAQKAAADNVLATFDLAGAVAASSSHDADLRGDSDRLDFVNQLKTRTPTQIKTFARNSFPSLTLAEQNVIARIMLAIAELARS